MKFRNLKIEQFLAITEAKLDLANRGLILIQGSNLDDTSASSNGAGKSSLADALCWALYGVTARGVSGDDVTNETAGKGTFVQIDMEDGDDVYRVARHRKHPKGKNCVTVLHLKKDGSVVDLTKGTDKLTQEVIVKVVGASHDVFKAAVYAGQEQLPDLPAMTDKHLKILIEEAAGVTVLEAAYKEARVRAADKKSNRDTIVQRRLQTSNEVDSANSTIADVTVRAAEWENDQKRFITEQRTKARQYVAEAKRLNSEIAKIDEQYLKDGIAVCDNKLATLNDEQQEQRQRSHSVTLAQAKVAEVKARLESLKRRHEGVRQQIADLEATIGKPCGECGRDHDRSTIDVHKSGLVKEGNGIVGEHRLSQQALNVAQYESQNLTSEFHAFEASMTDPSAIISQRACLQQEIDALWRLNRDRQLALNQATSIAEQIRRLRGVMNPHTSVIAMLEAKRHVQAEQLEVLERSAKEADAEVMVADEVAKIFSPAGVRAHILDEVTPFLNQQTSKYLATLSDGNIEATWTTLVRNSKGELREKFSIEVENGRGAKSFAGLSGGEKRKVRVATALALQDLVATRASKSIDLFIADEVDDALDPAGLERLMQILEEKARERGSVFVISHSDLKSWISDVVTVEKKGGATTLTEMVM